MLIEIRQHNFDSEIYELWQMVDGKAKYLMAIVHEGVLGQDVLPSNYEETAMLATILPFVADVEIGKECPHCMGSGRCVTTEKGESK